MNSKSSHNEDIIKEILKIDRVLSERFIALDPSGYFLITLEVQTKEIVVRHFGNDIDELGRAIDQETGIPISCKGEKVRKPLKTYKGKSAKEVGIQLTEGEGPNPISRIDHALYLGRELQRAETCLVKGDKYIQD